MKKGFFTVVLLTAAVFTAYSQSGTIRELSGDVELKHSGTAAFVPARQGSIVAQDTIVSTGFKSTAVIAIGSTVITVRPLTRLSLAEISSSSGTENLNVSLQTGRIRVDVKPPAGTRANTTVQGPSATASVRGTSFEMDSFSLNVIEGSVGFVGSDGLTTLVSAGFTSEVSNDGGTVDPVEVAVATLIPAAPVGAGFQGQ